MPEDGCAEHRVDPCAGMKDQVLADPAQRGREQHEGRHADGECDQRRFGAMDDHLVDDRLRHQRHAERQELDRQRRDEHVTPDRLVNQQRRYEPAKAEPGRRVVVPCAGAAAARQAQRRDQARLELGNGQRLGSHAAVGKVSDASAIARCTEHERWRRVGHAQQGKGACNLASRAFDQRCQRGDGETAGVEGALGLGKIVWRRMVARDQLRIERNAVQVAHAADEPEELGRLELFGPATTRPSSLGRSVDRRAVS